MFLCIARDGLDGPFRLSCNLRYLAAILMKRTKTRPGHRCSLGARHTLYLALFTSGLAGAQASGQTAGNDAVNLQKVTVTGPNEIELRRDGITNRIVVGREEIQRHNDNALSGILRRLPGITVSPTDGIRMRGLGAGYVQILIDGDPVPTGFSIDSIAPDLIERIEILPTAVAEYSTKSIAGTVNIVLRKASRSTQRTIKLNAARDGGDWYPSVSLSLSDKSENFYWSVNGTASHPDSRVDAHIIESVFDSQGLQTELRDTREVFDRKVKTYNIAPRLNWTFGSGDTLTLQSLLQRGDDDWTRDRRETVLIGGPSEFPHNVWLNDSRSWSTRTDLDWMHYFEDDSSLSVKFGFNYLKRDTDFSFLGFNPEGVFALDRGIVSDAVDSSYTSIGKYVDKIGEKHSLGFGWDGAYTRRTESRLQHDRTPEGTLLDVIDEDYTADVRRLALYAQDEWQTTPQLQTYLGIRWEGWDTSLSGRTIASTSNRSSEFSPITQVLWKLPGSEKDQVRVGLARTFSAPEPRRLVPRRYTVNNNNGPTNPDLQGNPDLRPEIAWGLDMAYEHYFGGAGLVSLSAYMRRLDDVIIESLFEEDGVWISMPVNAGKARTHGLTLEMKFSLNDLYETATDLQFHGSLTRNWSTVDSVPGPKNRLAAQTPLSGNVGMEWRPTGKLSTGLDYTYTGSSFSRVSPTRSTASWPERTLDLYANWKINGKNNVRLSLSNVLHQRQGLSSYYQDAGGSSSRLYATETYTGIKLLFEHQL